MNIDLKSKLSVVIGTAIASKTADVTNGTIFATNDHDSAVILVESLAYVSGGFTPRVFVGDAADLSDGAALDTSFIIGSLGKITAANQLIQFGIISKKKYYRVDLIADASSSATVGTKVIKGDLNKIPV